MTSEVAPAEVVREFYLRRTDVPTLLVAKPALADGGSGPDPSAPPVNVQLPCEPPFASESCRYALAFASEEELNKDPAVAIGCAGISCDHDAFDASAIVRRAVRRRVAALSLRLSKKDVPSHEKKLAGVLAGLRACATKQKEADGACALVRKHFPDDPEMEAEVRDELRASLGWFRDRVEACKFGAALFSVGFADRRSIREVFARDGGARTDPSTWFAPVGHGTPNEFAETFEHLLERLSHDADMLRRRLNEDIARDRVGFFHAATRPVPFRELGNIDADFFRSFCARAHDARVGELEPLAGDGVFARADNAHPRAVARVEGRVVQNHAAGVARDFCGLDALGLLEFASETDVNRKARRTGNLVAVNHDIPGEADAIAEVHVVCATRKLLLGFSRGTAFPKNELKRRFLERMGHARTRPVEIYVRDAHLLPVDVLAHLMWRLGFRVAIKKVVLTRRFETDLAYRARAWDLLEPLANARAEKTPLARAEKTPPDPDETSIPRLTLEAIAGTGGFCVVPTVRDVEELARGTPDERTRLEDARDQWVYVIDPPLFGRVEGIAKQNNRCVVAFPHRKKSEREKTVPFLVPKVNTRNVRRCAKTKAGGIVLPVGALAYYRELKPWAEGNATVFVPEALGDAWRRDMIETARGFFKKVSVVRVEDETYAPEDATRRAEDARAVVRKIREAAEETKRDNAE